MPIINIFVPPLAKATGGTAVLHQIAGHLHAAGREVRLVLREGGRMAAERAAESHGVPAVDWDALTLAPEDVWFVPEGWVNALAPGLQAGARTVVYVQNWAYLFSALPEGVGWDKLDVSFVAVSDPVAWFIRETLGVEAPVLRPGIDLDRFRPPSTLPPASPVRIAYMPRKNKALAAQIRAVTEARAARMTGAPPLRWIEIDGLDAAGVAAALRSSHIFLATGFPEGFALPPLEAMASGCLVVGYSGIGGFDYMRQAADIPGAASPWCPLREVAWDGNGLFAADGDAMAAAVALEHAAKWVSEGDERYVEVLQQAARTAQAYGAEAQLDDTVAVFGRFGV